MSATLYLLGVGSSLAYYWRDSNMAQCNLETKLFAGYGCAGRIIEEDWEMNY